MTYYLRHVNPCISPVSERGAPLVVRQAAPCLKVNITSQSIDMQGAYWSQQDQPLESAPSGGSDGQFSDLVLNWDDLLLEDLLGVPQRGAQNSSPQSFANPPSSSEPPPPLIPILPNAHSAPLPQSAAYQQQAPQTGGNRLGPAERLVHKVMMQQPQRPQPAVTVGGSDMGEMEQLHLSSVEVVLEMAQLAMSIRVLRSHALQILEEKYSQRLQTVLAALEPVKGKELAGIKSIYVAYMQASSRPIMNVPQMTFGLTCQAYEWYKAQSGHVVSDASLQRTTIDIFEKLLAVVIFQELNQKKGQLDVSALRTLIAEWGRVPSLTTPRMLGDTKPFSLQMNTIGQVRSAVWLWEQLSQSPAFVKGVPNLAAQSVHMLNRRIARATQNPGFYGTSSGDQPMDLENFFG